MTNRMTLVVVMFAMTGCGGAECIRDSDCSGTRVCRQGACLAGSGGGTTIGVGGFGTGGGPASAGGAANGGGASSAGGSASAGGTVSAGGSAGGGSASAPCPSGSTILVAGTAVFLSTTNTGGNPPRDFCFVAPSGASTIELVLSGGTCAPYTCIGDDVELYLKRGAPPDPFEPDSMTRQWTFTPGGMGLKGTSAAPGPWFLSQISGANTLGFRNVSLTLRFQ